MKEKTHTQRLNKTGSKVKMDIVFNVSYTHTISLERTISSLIAIKRVKQQHHITRAQMENDVDEEKEEEKKRTPEWLMSSSTGVNSTVYLSS